MERDWKNERAEASMREGTEKIMKDAQEKSKLDKALEVCTNELPADDLIYITEESGDINYFEMCIGIGLNQFFPEYVKIGIDK